MKIMARLLINKKRRPALSVIRPIIRRTKMLTKLEITEIKAISSISAWTIRTVVIAKRGHEMDIKKL